MLLKPEFSIQTQKYNKKWGKDGRERGQKRAERLSEEKHVHLGQKREAHFKTWRSEWKIKRHRKNRRERELVRKGEKWESWSQAAESIPVVLRAGEILESGPCASDQGGSEHNYLLFKSFSDTTGERRTLKLERQGARFQTSNASRKGLWNLFSAPHPPLACFFLSPPGI